MWAVCGKFTQAYSWSEIHGHLTRFLNGLGSAAPADNPTTPMRFANVLRLRDGQPEYVHMRWGFAGRGDTDPSRPRHMHARAETVDTLPTFADAFEHRRCVLLVDSFNEGEEVGSRTVQWTITPKDRKPLAIAAIYEEWANGEERLLTFVMITVPPNSLIGRITDRMPAILRPADIEPWLKATPQEAKALLRTYDDGGAWEMVRQGKPPKAPQDDLFS